MANEKIEQIGLEDLGRFGKGEETGDFYLDGEKLVTQKDLATLHEKFNAIIKVIAPLDFENQLPDQKPAPFQPAPK